MGVEQNEARRFLWRASPLGSGTCATFYRHTDNNRSAQEPNRMSPRFYGVTP